MLYSETFSRVERQRRLIAGLFWGITLMKSKRNGAALLLLTMVSGSVALLAQAAGDIQKKLTDQYTLSKITADRSDLVTAGAVLVLQKDGLVMYSTDTAIPPLNIYKEGRLQTSSGNLMRGLGSMMLRSQGAAPTSTIPQRKFVSGEKFWVTAINIQQDGVVFNVYSDPFNDVRYYGLLKFPFPKNSVPPVADVQRSVGEVISIQPADASGGDQSAQGSPQQAGAPQGNPQQGAPASGATQGASEAPLMAILPPPPPADQAPPEPKTISVGQTKTQVLATWGPPTKDIKLATKEVLVYPDMKVTLTAGKVSDVQ